MNVQSLLFILCLICNAKLIPGRDKTRDRTCAVVVVNSTILLYQTGVTYDRRSVDLDGHELIQYNRNLYSKLSVKTIQLIVIITIYKSGVCCLLPRTETYRTEARRTQPHSDLIIITPLRCYQNGTRHMDLRSWVK